MNKTKNEIIHSLSKKELISILEMEDKKFEGASLSKKNKNELIVMVTSKITKKKLSGYISKQDGGNSVVSITHLNASKKVNKIENYHNKSKILNNNNIYHLV